MAVLNSLILCILLWSAATWLPLEAKLNFIFAPALFVVKITLFALLLFPAVIGFGLSFRKNIISKADDFFKIHPTSTLTIDGLAGLLCIGFLFYLLSVSFEHHKLSAYILLFLGYVQFFIFKPDYSFSTHKIFEKFKLYPLSLIFSILTVAIIFFARLFRVFDFQTHGDAYLYHLSLAELWNQKAQSGLQLENVFSGYALAIEHYYYFLKLIFSGHAEQNAIAQISHVCFGWGVILTTGLSLLRNKSIWILLGFIAFMLSANVLPIFSMPKNDGYGLAIALLVFYFVYKKDFTAALFYGSFALVIKATALLNVAAVIFAALIVFPERRKILTLGLFTLLLNLTLFAPFGIRNYLITQNPFFPLLNNIFASPFLPTYFDELIRKRIYVDSHWLISWWYYIADYWLIFSFIFLALAIAIFRNGRSIQKDIFFKFALLSSILAFVLAQLAVGQYIPDMEHRFFVLSTLLLVIMGLSYFNFKDRLLKILCIGFLVAMISTSHFDTAMVSNIKFFKKTNLTQSLMHIYPQMQVNDYLSLKNTPTISLHHIPQNNSFFLEKGSFIHVTTFANYINQRDLHENFPDSLSEIDEKFALTHVITAKPLNHPEFSLEKQFAHLFLYQKNLISDEITR